MQYISVFLSVVHKYFFCSFAPRFNVLYEPDLGTEVCCTEDCLLENLLNINLALLQFVFFFSVSAETKKLSDDRSSIGHVLGWHTSNI